MQEPSVPATPPPARKPRRLYSPAKTLTALLLLAALVVWPYLRAAFDQPSPPAPARRYEFGGTTMGTTYMVKLGDSALSEARAMQVQEEVAQLLDAINQQMSTYHEASDISRFNRHAGAEPLPAGDMLVEVTAFALAFAARTGGAYDPTVMPLVDLWGFFRREPAPQHRPSPEAIAAARAQVGFAAVAVERPAALRKLRPDLRLDLNSIAPGYAVDRIAALVASSGCANVLVELGGEIAALGESAPGKPWRVGIDQPRFDSEPGASEQRRVLLANQAIATSGDYRHYFAESGNTYSHILDPRTGYPISNGVASVSVLAPDCMAADAWATALMVLGPDEGLPLLGGSPGVQALFILRRPDGTFEERASPGFPR